MKPNSEPVCDSSMQDAYDEGFAAGQRRYAYEQGANAGYELARKADAPKEQTPALPAPTPTEEPKKDPAETPPAVS